jgi:hypothetical protein
MSLRLMFSLVYSALSKRLVAIAVPERSSWCAEIPNSAPFLRYTD